MFDAAFTDFVDAQPDPDDMPRRPRVRLIDPPARPAGRRTYRLYRMHFEPVHITVHGEADLTAEEAARFNARIADPWTRWYPDQCANLLAESIVNFAFKDVPQS